MSLDFLNGLIYKNKRNLNNLDYSFIQNINNDYMFECLEKYKLIKQPDVIDGSCIPDLVFIYAKAQIEFIVYNHEDRVHFRPLVYRDLKFELIIKLRIYLENNKLLKDNTLKMLKLPEHLIHYIDQKRS